MPGEKPSAGRALRILVLLTDGYGGHGGIAAYNRDVLRALCEDPEIAQVVAIPRAAPRPTGDLPVNLSYDLSGVFGGGAYFKALFRQLGSGRFDLVYCAHVNLAPLAWLAAKLSRAPWLLAIYGIDAWKKSPRRITAYAAGKADHVLSISKVTLDRFLAFTPYRQDQTSLMPNAIHLDSFGIAPAGGALRRRWGLEGKRVILTFGRMDPLERYKGFDEILELMPALSESHPDLVYLLAGDGGDRPRLEAKAAELGVAGRAVFTGYVEEAEKADLYRLADVYAMPSYGEGFGFVFLEALACGVPVVASAIDGGREAVRDGMLGRLVDPHNPDELYEAIVGALGEEKRIPEGLAYFAWLEFRARVQRLIGSLVGDRGAS